MMDLSSLTSVPGARKKRKVRVGRGPGSTTGKTAGRGSKGQQSRAGYSRRKGFEGGQMPLHRRLPKRGFHHYKRHGYIGINVDMVQRAFDDGARISAEAIVEAGLAGAGKDMIKLLGRGELTKKLHVSVHAISPAAQQKIEAAGGSVSIIPVPVSGKKAGKGKKAEAPSGEGR